MSQRSARPARRGAAQHPAPARARARGRARGAVPGERPADRLRQLGRLIGVSLLYGAVVLAVVSARRDAGELPIAWMVGAGLGWLLGFVVPMLPRARPAAGLGDAALAARRDRRGRRSPIGVRGARARCSTRTVRASVQYGAANFVRGHTCLEIGLATALVPIGLGALLPPRRAAGRLALGRGGARCRRRQPRRAGAPPALPRHRWAAPRRRPWRRGDRLGGCSPPRWCRG